MSIKVYVTHLAGNQVTNGNQRKLKHILDTNKITYTEIDISDPNNSNEKENLQRKLASMNKKLSLPQVIINDEYCCDFDEIQSAVECDTLNDLLKLDN